MKQIPNESIKKWAYANSNKLSHPVSIAAVCPDCSLSVVFSTKRRLYDPNRDTSSCSSSCPACDATVHFWVVDMVAHTRKDGEGDPGVYMLPAAQEHMIMDDHQEIIPDSVLQYCKTAQDIYFSGNLIATNVLIKTALETIFHNFLPVGNSRTELSKMIRESSSSINKNDPLAQLATSTMKQGDLHELFSSHQGTDQETADAMMELLETLIMHLYVMPERFKELGERFAALKIAHESANPTPASNAAADDFQHQDKDHHTVKDDDDDSDELDTRAA